MESWAVLGTRFIRHTVGESTAGQVRCTLPPRGGKREKEGKGLLLKQLSEQNTAKGGSSFELDNGAADRLDAMCMAAILLLYFLRREQRINIFPATMTGTAVSAYAIPGLHYKPTLSGLEALSKTHVSKMSQM